MIKKIKTLLELVGVFVYFFVLWFGNQLILNKINFHQSINRYLREDLPKKINVDFKVFFHPDLYAFFESKQGKSYHAEIINILIMYSRLLNVWYFTDDWWIIPVHPYQHTTLSLSHTLLILLTPISKSSWFILTKFDLFGCVLLI